MEVRWRFAKPEDVAVVAENMRDIDRKELYLAGGWEPLEAMQQSFNASVHCRCIEADGVPVAVFGVRRPFILSPKGLIWLLGTKDFVKIKKSFVKSSKKYIDECFDYASSLENYVWIENKLSIRWLKWCGFKFDEPKPYGLKKELFLHFYKEKKNV